MKEIRPPRIAKEPKPSPRRAGKLDRGVEKTVLLLRSEGVETSQSCEGGKGHACAEPKIDFHGLAGEGFRVLGICISHGLPVKQLNLVWDVQEKNQPTGPIWQLTFWRRPG
jgi:hypothetical protein